MVKRQLRDSIENKNYTTKVGVVDEKKEEIPGGRQWPY